MAFPASGRFGGALAGEYASDSRIRHSPGSAVAFLKRLADSGNNQRYRCRDVEGNIGLVDEPYIKVDNPEGGYFLWVEGIQGRARDLVTAAAIEGAIFPLGSVFFVDKPSENNHFRLAYTRESKEHLAAAGKRIRSAFEKILD